MAIEGVVRNVRRSDRAISMSEAKEILMKGEYGVLSTVSRDGQPYGVPLNYSYKDEEIYIHCAVAGHKLENIADNDRVSFCVVGKTEIAPEYLGTKYESVIVFGRMLEVVDAEKREGLTEIWMKYFPENMEEGIKAIENRGEKTRVYKIDVEMMTGKARKG